MGAPKQKWTAEEEAALKAGVIKYGAGKWRTILKDPEFSGILCLRSNVDLKDKWRNMCVMSNGCSSRERSKVTSQRSHTISKSSDENPMPLSPVAEDSDDEILDAMPFAASSEALHVAGPKRSTSRLANLIMEAIANLKEPRGSNKTAIAMYIEDQYLLPPDFVDMLSMELETMTAHGKLIKVKRNYRIAPTSVFQRQRSSRTSLLEGIQKETIRVERDHCKPLIKSHVDFEIEKLRSMTSEEAAILAEQAVAEAEAAIAEAEEAAREAEAAEAEAEAAQAFAEAAMRTLKNRKAGKLMVS